MFKAAKLAKYVEHEGSLKRRWDKFQPPPAPVHQGVDPRLVAARDEALLQEYVLDYLKNLNNTNTNKNKNQNQNKNKNKSKNKNKNKKQDKTLWPENEKELFAPVGTLMEL